MLRCFINFLLAGCVLSNVYGDTMIRTTEMVAMRDGTKLATDIYTPRRGGPTYPVLLGRTPYGKSLSSDLSSYNDYNIVVVIQDVRGLNASEGMARPFSDDGWGELQDGYDTVQWIRAQPWCNGKIATIGSSAGAILQVQLAGTVPPGLLGQLIEFAPMSGYHTTFYQNGVFRKSMIETWMTVVKFPPAALQEVRAHPYYDEFWSHHNLGERMHTVDWPMAIVSGWFDIFQQGSIELFQNLQERATANARENSFLLIGPWTHAGPNQPAGELSFLNNDRPSGWPGRSDWIQHWLNDRPFAKQLARVYYYTMGELPYRTENPGNVWRTADSWPPAARLTPFYLTQDRTLSLQNPPDGVAQFIYDPSNPVPTHGGPNLVLPAGSFDQREQESRPDVLTFTTEPLENPVEITGHLYAVLYVSTTATDTDFTAKFCDVYPDGRSMLFNDGIARLSLRSSLSRPQPVEAGLIYRLEVDLWSTSLIVNKGHRIRLSISSSNSPRFEPNPNTGSLDWTDPSKVTALQSLYFGGDRASYLALPIVSGVSSIENWNNLRNK